MAGKVVALAKAFEGKEEPIAQEPSINDWWLTVPWELHMDTHQPILNQLFRIPLSGEDSQEEILRAWSALKPFLCAFAQMSDDARPEDLVLAFIDSFDHLLARQEQFRAMLEDGCPLIADLLRKDLVNRMLWATLERAGMVDRGHISSIMGLQEVQERLVT